MSESLAQLWFRYCAGDAAAFDRVYAELRGPLFRYVKRQCGGCDRSEELYQDVWMRAIAARASFEGEHFQAWLFRIAHNRVVDFHRANGHDVDDDPATDLDTFASTAARPDHWSHLRDCVERLFAMLAALPLPQRDAFLLKEEAGLSLAEIADAAGTSRETVKSRLRYAMKQLRDGLEDCDD